ncbi:MAG: hypothetical protein FJY54_17985 [Betaproteobacteria bacterium]|nr:hypothetical protein [Betaproteobacteria bacterium]
MLSEFAGLRAGERVLILAETEGAEGVKRAFYRAAREAAGENVSMAIYDRRPAYTHPPEPLPAAVAEADLVICLDIYLSHTKLEQSARAAGTRFFNLHPARFAALRRAVLGVDYREIRRRGRELARLFGAGRRGLITCPRGSHLEFEIDAGREVSIGSGYARKPGDYATLPNGKIKVPVVRASMTGTFVVNGVIIPPINELSELVTLRFNNSRLVDISGGAEAKAYMRFLESFNDPSMYVLDHLTFGFNPRATLSQPPPPAFSSEAEKVMGCVNIGLGRAGLKGKQHTDVVSVGTTVVVDGRPVIIKGRYTI